MQVCQTARQRKHYLTLIGSNIIDELIECLGDGWLDGVFTNRSQQIIYEYVLLVPVEVGRGDALISLQHSTAMKRKPQQQSMSQDRRKIHQFHL